MLYGLKPLPWKEGLQLLTKWVLGFVGQRISEQAIWEGDKDLLSLEVRKEPLHKVAVSRPRWRRGPSLSLMKDFKFLKLVNGMGEGAYC